jgi:MFS family permease
VDETNWVALGLLMGSVLLVALYGLAASGHFPAEFRSEKVQRGWGALVLWGTIIATGLAAVVALVLAWRALPWYAIVIGAGAALLFAPLLLQPPPKLRQRRRGLLVSAGAVVLAALMWRVASPVIPEFRSKISDEQPSSHAAPGSRIFAGANSG